MAAPFIPPDRPATFAPCNLLPPRHSICQRGDRAMQSRLQTIQTISKYALGLMAFLAGLDKFLNLLTNWEQYVSPLAQRMLPLTPTSLMHIVGVIEMVVGLMILTKATRLGAYVASAWLVCIALALLTTGHFFDVAVRDLELAVAAFGPFEYWGGFPPCLCDSVVGSRMGQDHFFGESSALTTNRTTASIAATTLL